jgi:hypothetical protein
MSGTVFTSTIGKSFSGTVVKILNDSTGKYEASSDYTDWMEVDSLDKHYEDEVEYGGAGLLSEKAEGTPLAVVTMREHNTIRWRSRTYGAKMMVTKEASEDNKFPELIAAAKQLRRGAQDTVEIDATSLAAEAFTTPNPGGGDGLALFSASHTLPQGGTFSNTLATAMAPSRLAIQTMRTQAGRFPGYNGITRGHMLEKIVCPLDQEMTWWGILESALVPESNNNEINTVKRLNIKVKALKHWTQSSTQWFCLTDCEQKIRWRWRRRFETNSWLDENNTVQNFSLTYRSTKGWSNPRCAIGSNA